MQFTLISLGFTLIHVLIVRAVASGGASGARPPFEICAPHFTFGPLVAAYIQYRILKCAPPSGFWSPLLLNPGDGPVYSHCGSRQFEFKAL